MAIVNQLRLLARLHAKAAESFEVFGPDLIELVFAFAGGEANIEVGKKVIRVPDGFAPARCSEADDPGAGWRQ